VQVPGSHAGYWLSDVEATECRKKLLLAGTINEKAAAALPRVPGNGRLRLPTSAQQVTAEKVVARLWPSGL
jgi:hypothetical protein